MKLLIGITGGIGAGKSAVTKHLRSRGEVVICADETAKAVVEPDQPGAIALREYYGNDYFLPGGVLNRRKLSEHVFGNPERISRLNSLLHPLIISGMYDQAQKHSGRVFLDAALLIQSGMNKKVDYVWLVVADMETRVHRVMQRDGAEREAVLRRISNQMSDDEMRRFAHEVIENNGTLEELHQRIDILMQRSEYTR